MLTKGKLKFRKRVVLDRLGSLVIGFADDDDDLDFDLGFDSGEELKTFRSDPPGSEDDQQHQQRDNAALDLGCETKKPEIVASESVRWGSDPWIRRSKAAEFLEPISTPLSPSSPSSLWNDAGDKENQLESELSQKVINLEALQRIASCGLPDQLRAVTWKLLLGYLPLAQDSWERELAINRRKYLALREELLLDPSEFSKRNEATVVSIYEEKGGKYGLLTRHDVSCGDHPLNLGKASVWHQYFKDAEIADQIDRDLQRTHQSMKFFSGESSFSQKNKKAMRNILLLFAKLNPAIQYVQGMNEVLAPLYYVFSNDPDAHNASNAEADSFACFVQLLSDSVDHFCQQLDNSSVGILSTLSRLAELLKANDRELWQHLETSKVKPQFYAFRWITLLLTQEFDLLLILRLWDSLLSNSLGVQGMLLRICCAMLLCVRKELLRGDFAANLKLLQHYPPIDIDYLLQVAQELEPLSSANV